MAEERLNEERNGDRGIGREDAVGIPPKAGLEEPSLPGRTARVWDRARAGAPARGEAWPWLLAILAVFVAAFLWRWHFASRARFYTYDSYYYLVLARNLRHGLHYSVAGHPHFKFMPLYPVSIALFDLFLPSLESAGKVSNVFFTSACVFPIYAIGALVFGRRTGLAAAGLFAFEPITTAWSSVPMSDGLLAFLACLGSFFILKWMKEEQGGMRYLYLAAGAGGLALVTRWEGALLLLFMGILLLYSWWRRRLRFRNLLIFTLVALAPFSLFALRNLMVFGTPLKSAYLEELRNYPREFESLNAWGRLARYLIFSDVEPLGIARHFYHYAYLLFGYSGLALSLVLRRYRKYGIYLAGWLLCMGPLHFVWWFGSVRFLFAAVPSLCLGAGALIGLPWVKVERERTGMALPAFLLLVALALVGVLALTGRPMTNDIFTNGILSLEDDVGGLAARDAVAWLKGNGGDAGVATSLGPMVSFYLGRDALFLGEWQGFEPADLRIDHLVEDARALEVRYLVLWSWEPEEEAPLRYLGLGPELLQELKLVGVWEYPPSTEWNRTVYAWIFEVPAG